MERVGKRPESADAVRGYFTALAGNLGVAAIKCIPRPASRPKGLAEDGLRWIDRQY